MDLKLINNRFLGASGQTINDLREYSSEKNTLDLMECTLKWGHIAPTAPDTLNCYPFNDTDPFILHNTPHVYFIGNQEKFETRFIKQGKIQVRLISLPSFVESGLIVLVNLKTLDVHPVHFDTESLAL
jgi:DNA polymerase delta subunit 2